MTRIFIPEELTLAQLVAFPADVSPLYRRFQEQMQAALLHGDSKTAQTAAAKLHDIARGAGDGYIAALAELYTADLTRHKHSAALDALAHAVSQLHVESRVIARYNEALGLYLQGLIYYAKDKDIEVGQAFGRASKLLAEAADLANHYGGHPRSADIDRLNLWMTSLLTLGLGTRGLDIAPLYELNEGNKGLQFAGATFFNSETIEMPRSTLPPLEETYFIIELPPAPKPYGAPEPRRRLLIKRVWGIDPQSAPLIEHFGRFTVGENRRFSYDNNAVMLGTIAEIDPGKKKKP